MLSLPQPERGSSAEDSRMYHQSGLSEASILPCSFKFVDRHIQF